MKKSIWLGAMTAMMLFASSCQNDEYSEGMEGQTSVVSFTLEQPGISSRGFSDGTGPTKMVFAVYDENGAPVTPKTGYAEGKSYGEATISDKKATVQIGFEEGQVDKEYTFVFWAAHSDALYDFDADSGTITDTETGTEIAANNEKRDAFFASVPLKVTSAGAEQVVTLRRPFAQLNIGSQGEFISYQATKCEVKVSNVYTSFNLIDGKVIGESVERIYSMSTFPENEVFPAGTDVKYLSMNYLLVPADQELVTVTYTLSDGNNPKDAVPVPNVPVQRNYRTNIIIKPNFAAPNTAVFLAEIDNSYEKETLAKGVIIDGKYYDTLDEAFANVTNGSVITLGTGEYTIPAGATDKELTFVGTGNPEDVIIDVEGDNHKLKGSIVTFENLTLKLSSSGNYQGFKHIKDATYRKCIIEGQHFLYGEKNNFDECTFENSGDCYNVWTYGADATFTGCTFNCDGKAVYIYNEGITDDTVIFNNCVFNDKDGLVNETKAAIETGVVVDSEDDRTNKAPYAKHTIYINGCTVNGFNNTEVKTTFLGGTSSGTHVWGNKNMMTSDNLNVIIDGVDVY